MTLRGLVDRATHSPFGLILIVGAAASLVQANVKELPGWASALLYIVSVLGLAVGGGGIGLSQARSDTDQLAHAAELTQTRLLPPFHRMHASYRALGRMQIEIINRYAELRGRVANNKIEWAPVDKAMALIAQSTEGQLRDFDQALEEWRDLLPAELAKLEQDLLPRRTAEIDRT